MPADSRSFGCICHVLGHFNLIQYLADDFVRSHITCFSLISQADTVTQYIMCHSTHIFRNNITATFDESITAGSQCQVYGRTG